MQNDPVPVNGDSIRLCAQRCISDGAAGLDVELPLMVGTAEDLSLTLEPVLPRPIRGDERCDTTATQRAAAMRAHIAQSIELTAKIEDDDGVTAADVYLPSLTRRQFGRRADHLRCGCRGAAAFATDRTSHGGNGIIIGRQLSIH